MIKINLKFKTKVRLVDRTISRSGEGAKIGSARCCREEPKAASGRGAAHEPAVASHSAGSAAIFMTATWRLLIIEENPSLSEDWAKEHSATTGELELERVQWTSFAPATFHKCRADLIVPVAITPEPEAIRFFQWLRENPLAMPTLAILPEDGNDDLVRDAVEVADEFIIAPVRTRELNHRITRILGRYESNADVVQDRLIEEFSLKQLVGRNPVFVQTIAKIPRIARSNMTVLITGETGTGKELCARAIHQLGPRRDFPFIPVDCASFPDHLFENEMFGHARGAFTDAHRDQKGLIALAEGGTLFLDEVDSLSPAAQSKLLRFLQEHSYRPIGSDRFVRANVNVVAATNRDLEALVHAREFRADLFFRLNVLRLVLVPLRERRDDIVLLARHFLEVLSAETEMPRKSLSLATIHRLKHHDWPGNVRELYNVIQSATVFSEGTEILPTDILRIAPKPQSQVQHASFREARTRAVEAFERHYVEEVLLEAGGNVTRAARVAQKDRRAFGRLIKRYNISRDPL